MKERVPSNDVPTFCQKERNGPIVKERNGEKNGVPNFKEREERGKFGEFLGEKCKNMRKFSKFSCFCGQWQDYESFGPYWCIPLKMNLKKVLKKVW